MGSRPHNTHRRFISQDLNRERSRKMISFSDGVAVSTFIYSLRPSSEGGGKCNSDLIFSYIAHKWINHHHETSCPCSINNPLEYIAPWFRLSCKTDSSTNNIL